MDFDFFRYDPWVSGFGFMSRLFDMFWIVWLIICCILMIVHVIISVHVYRDAKVQPERALALTPWIWTLISLGVPVFGMPLYWIMNRSTLVRQA